MRKFLSRVLSVIICTSVVLSTAISGAAETIKVEPTYPIHGNKCGLVITTPKIDRDVQLSIVQISADGNYKYYDTVIPAGGESSGENDYSFEIEGKDDALYSMTIGVEKYKGSNLYNLYTHEFTVLDTDDIITETVKGYTYNISVEGAEKLDSPTLTSITEPIKDENNIVSSSLAVSFPISDTKLGDVNFDNTINLADVVAIATYVLDKNYFNETQIAVGDYNQDGKTGLLDAVDVSISILPNNKKA